MRSAFRDKQEVPQDGHLSTLERFRRGLKIGRVETRHRLQTVLVEWCEYPHDPTDGSDEDGVRSDNEWFEVILNLQLNKNDQCHQERNTDDVGEGDFLYSSGLRRVELGLYQPPGHGDNCQSKKLVHRNRISRKR